MPENKRQHTNQVAILGRFSNDSDPELRDRSLNCYDVSEKKRYTIKVGNATVENCFLPPIID